MSLALTKIKSRIKSIDGAYKVTKAMKLVSTVKLQKWKGKMNESSIYTAKLKEISDDVLRCVDNIDSPLVKTNDDVNKDLFIVITSSLGLCGSYNVNIFHYLDSVKKDDDEIIVLGTKGLAHYEPILKNLNSDFKEYTSIKDEKVIKNLLRYSISGYENKKYRSVRIIYTHYKNSITFEVKDFRLLPLIKEESNSNIGFDPIFEPSKKELVEKIIPLVIENQLFSKLLESEVSEQGSRCNAMDNATSNAEELLDELQIEFNKARQGAITQEIVEIVAASKGM
ncbi:MAG: ATP synthase F1 subunit gamma [Bacilli bacterium]